MVKDLFSSENKLFTAKLKHLDLVISQLERKGVEPPQALLDFRDFLHM